MVFIVIVFLITYFRLLYLLGFKWTEKKKRRWILRLKPIRVVTQGVGAVLPQLGSRLPFFLGSRIMIYYELRPQFQQILLSNSALSSAKTAKVDAQILVFNIGNVLESRWWFHFF